MNACKLALEGYAMFFLTHYGSPKPWSPEEVQLMLTEMRQELDNRKHHSFTYVKRVWAQKPYE